MSLREMKNDDHDALWRAQQRWFELRARGETKNGLKMAGLRAAGDPNRFTRGIVFAGSTRLTYERDLRSFLTFAHERYGVEHLRDITDKHAKAYLDYAIDRRWAAETLDKLRSELAKLGCAIHKTASFAALSLKYGRIIRDLEASGVLAGPTRETPSGEVVAKATEILRERDERYYLAARLQMETAGRSVSCTERITQDTLKGDNRIEIVGKGGKRLIFVISSDLYAKLAAHLAAHPGPLAGAAAYRAAWSRAVTAAGGRVKGSHGLRRRSTQDFYRSRYAEGRQRRETTEEARKGARRDAVERLGHGRDRLDQANAYLGGRDWRLAP